MAEYAARPDRLDIPYQQIRLFADAINASGMHVRNMIASGKLHAVKDGRATKIVETPRQYLESLPPFQPGSPANFPPGPGRPRRQEEQTGA